MDLSDDSSLSSLSSVEDLEPPKTLKLKHGKLVAEASRLSPKSTPEPESPEPEREPSPSHEYVLADNPDIAIIVMFRARFSDAFPTKMPHIGPQDIEQGIVEVQLTERIEQLLCALLGLVLNRKKYVERGHYGRALEDAILGQRNQWPAAWGGLNPLSGNKTFQAMNPTERLLLLKTLVIWSLSTSEAVGEIIKTSYKQNRHDDDRNQPLSVQPWGQDSKKRRYWLIEGQNDTSFRVYRESNPKLKNNTWWSVAGTVEELTVLSTQLGEEKSQAARRLAESMQAAIPRLEEGAIRRGKREYKQKVKERFNRDFTGVSVYAGRTRGKRPRYDLESFDDDLTDSSIRRSSRHTGTDTPADGTTMTSSGRQVRSRFGRSYGDALEDDERRDTSEPVGDDSEASGRLRGGDRRSTRVSSRPAAKGWAYLSDGEEGDDEDDLPSGDEWHGDDDDHLGKFDDDDDEAMSEDVVEDDVDSLMEDAPPRSKVVTLYIPSWRHQRHHKSGDDTDHAVASLPKVEVENDTKMDQNRNSGPVEGIVAVKEEVKPRYDETIAFEHTSKPTEQRVPAVNGPPQLPSISDLSPPAPHGQVLPVLEPPLITAKREQPEQTLSTSFAHQNGVNDSSASLPNRHDLYSSDATQVAPNGHPVAAPFQPVLPPSSSVPRELPLPVEGNGTIYPLSGVSQQQPLTLPFSPTKKAAAINSPPAVSQQPSSPGKQPHAGRPWEQ